MPSTFLGLSIGKSGLYAYQAAINTAGHNASNAVTAGYSRQVVKQSASTPISVNSSYGMIGTGVNVDSIERVRNAYYDEKYRYNKAIYGTYNTKEYYLTAIENYFSEVNADGTTATFTDFHLSLQNLATNVSDTTYRADVAQTAQTFTEFINYLGNSMQTIQTEVNQEIKSTVYQVNTLATKIAATTKQINILESNGGTANDLRDARDLLVDELSALGSIEVSENEVGTKTGVTTYCITLDGKTLVNTFETNQLVISEKEGLVNQTDISGLYQISWSDGQEFNSASSSLGGRLQALFEVRDGNNQDNFTGSKVEFVDGNTVKVSGTNCNSISKLNIPETDGIIKIGIKEFKYESFSVEVDAATGNYIYSFKGLENAETKEGITEADCKDKTAKIGSSVNFKGIPYYQAQLNEFVRTYAMRFNEVHMSGEDLYGNAGKEFFNGLSQVHNSNYSFEDTASGIGNSLAAYNGSGVLVGSYYNITALNFTVSKAVLEDVQTIACSKKISNGVEDKSVLDKLIALQSDQTMFKQGTPSSFLQMFTANIGVDAKQATLFSSSQNNILQSVDNQRMSISGVDEDEEAMNLSKYQKAYFLSCKIIQVLDEVYDKLINGTAI